jgi:alpha-L-fucosidase
LTDTTVDAGEAWGYVEGQACKSAGALVHYLVDNVSKNGALLLSVGPRADGTIPDEVRDVLESVGRWLALNGEAIYGTCPWVTEGEGPALRGAAGAFTEYAPRAYTGSDIRFTAADDVLYAVLLAWPGPEAVILSVPERLHPGEIRSVRMLGVDQPLAWRWTEEALRVRMPERRPCEHAWVLRIDRKHPFRG